MSSFKSFDMIFAMKSSLIIFVSAFLLSSCVSYSEPRMTIKEVMETWIGHNESSLISSWGIPTRTYESGNQKFLEYTYGRTSYTTSTNANLRNNPYTCNQYYCPPPTATTYQNQYWCTYTITVENKGNVNQRVQQYAGSTLLYSAVISNTSNIESTSL